MEASVERAERLVDAASDVTAMIAYRMQTDPAVRAMRSLVRDGFVGDPVHVHGSMSQRLLEMIPDPNQWRVDPDLAGPGASVTDLGIYPLNTTRFVLDADPVAVQGAMWSGAEGFEDVPDERSAFTVEYGDTLAAFSASQNATDGGFLRITGTEGELELEPAFVKPSGLSVSRAGLTASVDIEDASVYAQMREEFDYFADRVLAGRDPHPDPAHGLVDMRAIEAVFAAAERGERVEL